MILQDVKSKFNIDKNKIYATDMSNEARFSYRLACEMSNIFAAVAAVSGVKSINLCNPQNPISILHIHSEKDTIVPFEEGLGKEDIDYGSVQDTIDYWVNNNKCKINPSRIFENNLSYCDSYNNCEDNSEIRLCVTSNSGHSWPEGEKARFTADSPSTAFDAIEMIWDFFKEHPKK